MFCIHVIAVAQTTRIKNTLEQGMLEKQTGTSNNIHQTGKLLGNKMCLHESHDIKNPEERGKILHFQLIDR